MKTFKQFLEEGNKLAKLAGNEFGTVSPETGETNTRKTKKAAHQKIQDTLRRLSDNGKVSFSGPHNGRYKYSGTEAPAKEGSYILKPGAKSGKHFKRILTAVGTRFKQQSVLHVDKSGSGMLHYTDGENKGKSETMGKLHYNSPLTTGSGDTQIKGTKSSFTVKE
jgi:hypothetical protein